MAAVWLHGAGLNAHTFDGTILAAGLPSLAVDLPGHGDSGWRSDLDYSPATNAVPVGALMRSVAPAAALLVGQSLGGLTAVALAAEAPGTVRALVLIDVTPGLLPADAGQVRDFLAGPTSFASRDEIVDRAEQFGFGPSRAALERGVFLNTRVRGDGRVVFNHHLANMGEGEVPYLSDFRSLWPAAEALRLPVLLVRASRGVAHRPARGGVPGPRAGLLSRPASDAGHNVQEDAPAELAAVAVDFLRRHPDGPPGAAPG